MHCGARIAGEFGHWKPKRQEGEQHRSEQNRTEQVL